MNSISDNDLILYFDRDGLDAGRIAEIDATLRTSSDVRARYAQLQRVLQVADAEVPIEPDAAFTQRIWARLQQRIEPPANSPLRDDWRSRLRDSLQSLLSPRFALAATCMLALAVVLLASLIAVGTWRHALPRVANVRARA